MPHIIIEYSQKLTENFNVVSLVENIHKSIIGMHGCEEDRIKTRAYPIPQTPYTHFNGKSIDDPMVHVNLKLMPGRTDEQKIELADTIYAVGEFYRERIPQGSFTVEVSEMHGPSYKM